MVLRKSSQQFPQNGDAGIFIYGERDYEKENVCMVIGQGESVSGFAAAEMVTSNSHHIISGTNNRCIHIQKQLS